MYLSSYYMYFSPNTKPNWSLSKISRLADACSPAVELNPLWLLKIQTLQQLGLAWTSCSVIHDWHQMSSFFQILAKLKLRVEKKFIAKLKHSILIWLKASSYCTQCNAGLKVSLGRVQHGLLKPLVYFSLRCEMQSFACVWNSVC